MLSENDTLFSDVILQVKSLSNFKHNILENYIYETVSVNSFQSEIHFNSPIQFSYIVELIIYCGGDVAIISPLALKEKIYKLATSIVKRNLCDTT